MSVRLNWKGDEVLAKVRVAERQAVEEITTEAAAQARGDHGWQNVTGAAERSLQAQPIASSQSGTRGGIGFGVPYGRFLDHGARGRPGDRTLERAGDARFRELAARIAKRLHL